MTATPVEIADADARPLVEMLDEAQLVELTAAIAQENLRARMNHAFGLRRRRFQHRRLLRPPQRTPRVAPPMHGVRA